MITPFGPPNNDLDHLNTILDAQATGKRAPVPDPASATDALAATARLVSRTPLDAREDASAETLDSIWRNVMHAHAIPDSTAITGARPQAVRSSSRVEENRGRRATASSPWFSVAAMVVLLVGIVGGAWAMRGGTGGGGEPIRLAAVSPLGTPEGESQLLTWIQPEECTAEPMTTEEYAAIMREQPDISGRSYEVVGPADPATAEAVARAAREYEACENYGNYRQTQSLKSDAFIFFNSFSVNRTISSEELYEMSREHGMELSADLPISAPNDYAVILDSEPPTELIEKQLPLLSPGVFFSLTFEPGNASMLSDGRVVVPATVLYWSGGDSGDWFHIEKWQIDESTSLSTVAVILTRDDGEWKVDESLVVCPLEGCAAYWALEALATPVATPEG